MKVYIIMEEDVDSRESRFKPTKVFVDNKLAKDYCGTMTDKYIEECDLITVCDSCEDGDCQQCEVDTTCNICSHDDCNGECHEGEG